MNWLDPRWSLKTPLGRRLRSVRVSTEVSRKRRSSPLSWASAKPHLPTMSVASVCRMPQRWGRNRELFGVNLSWLITVEGTCSTIPLVRLVNRWCWSPPASKKQQATVEQLAEAVNSSPPTYREQLFEPRPPPRSLLSRYASAGHGFDGSLRSPGADLDIDEFCDLAFHTSAKHVMNVPVKGDSMLPTFAHGDFAAIDRRRVEGEPEDGRSISFRSMVPLSEAGGMAG